MAVNWAYYQGRPWESLQIPLGGLAWPGALVGGLLSLGLYAGLARRSFGELADALIPLLLCLIVSAWLGCWLDGCAYGSTTSAWWGVPARDEWGQTAHRWPLQPLSALLSIALFWLLEQFAGRAGLRAGALASMALLCLSALMIGACSLRADPGLLWQGYRLDAWLALSFALLAASGLLACVMAGRRREPDDHKTDD